MPRVDDSSLWSSIAREQEPKTHCSPSESLWPGDALARAQDPGGPITCICHLRGAVVC